MNPSERLARAAVVALLVACVDGPTGPGNYAPATLRLRVTLPAGTPAAWTPAGETLHVAVRRAGRVDPIVEASLLVPGDSLTATLTVPLAYAVERFVVLGEARYGGLVLFLGFETVQLAAAGDTTVTLAATYAGPGARAATYTLGARDSTLGQGDTASLVPVVRDSTGQVIANVPARYVAANPAVVSVDAAGVLTSQPGASDTARITGYLPMGLSSSLLVRRGPPVIPSAGTRTWVGGDPAGPRDWARALNWTPAGVPTSTDTAVIVATDGGVGAGNDPVLSSAAVVAALRIAGGNLTLDGHTLTVTGDFSTENSAGTITMQNPVDTLRVQGRAVFQGGLTRDLLTEGVLLVAGDFEQRNDGENRGAFQAYGNHRTVLDGSASQRLHPEGDVTFGHLEFANTGGITGELAQIVEVDRTLRFTTATAFDGGAIQLDVGDSLIMTVDSRLTTARLRLSGGMAVAGAFEVATVEFAGNNQEIQPDLSYQNVEVTDDVRLVGPTSFAGTLLITERGNLTVNGHTLSVQQLDVATAGANRGALTMQQPGDLLIVAGTASFDGDTTPGRLTDGVLRIAGDLTVGASTTASPLRAGGNHRTVLDGAAVQQVRIGRRGATFHDLDIANSAGVDLPVPGTQEVAEFTVGGTLRVTTAIPVTGPDVGIDVGDSLVTAAGSTLTLGGLILRGGIAAAGALDVRQIEFAGANQPVPAGAAFREVMISGTARLTGATSVAAYVGIRGPGSTLTLGGHRLSVGGSFSLGGVGTPEGVVTMTHPADSLVVGGDAVFYGASTAGLLTAGTLVVAGGLFAGDDPAAFQPSGTHRTVFNGAAQQTMDFVQPGAATSRFNDLDLANTAGGVWLRSDVHVAGQLRTTAPAAQTISGTSHHLLTVGGVDVARLTLDSVALAIGAGPIARFDTVTLQRQSRTATQLAIAHPGAAAPFTFTGLRFVNAPTTGLYVSASDLAPADGDVLTIDLVASFPADGSAQTATVGGAVVNWTGGTPPISVGQLSAGVTFSCAVTTANSAFCWGINTDGQLGDGTTVSRSAPTAVVGGFSFTQISAGGQHACALTPAGAIYCWGSNTYGQLGDGTTTSRGTPAPIASGLTFTTVAAGDQYTCALSTAALAYCWGRNTFGQLGDLTTTDRSSPVPVDGAMAFSALHAGLNHACAVTGGAGYCWGSNTSGQLGDGTTTNSATPVLVGGALGGFTFTHVSPAGEHSCGVSGGQAYCWGANNQGQLGDGTTTPHLLPGAVSGGLAFSQVRAGGNGYTCGVTTSGVAHCWGLNNAGQLGDGTLTRRLAPVPVSGGLVFSGLSAGFAHVLAGAAAGAYAWGSNNAGQLGDGTTTARSTPVPVVWVAP